jgi:hypothetical protein
LIDIPYTSYTIKRSSLGIIVVTMDVLIVLSLVIAFQILAYFEKKEDKDYDMLTLTTEDFAVSIKNLPSKKTYTDLADLKSALWSHLETNILGPNQVVNIHFARADVKKLNILMKVRTLNQEKKRLKARMRLEKDLDKCNELEQ